MPHPALSLIKLTDEKIDDFIYHDTASSQVAWKFRRQEMQQMSLATMRALVTWMEADCTNPDHWDFYDRDHGTRADCQHCWAELKAALREEPASRATSSAAAPPTAEEVNDGLA